MDADYHDEMIRYEAKSGQQCGMPWPVRACRKDLTFCDLRGKSITFPIGKQPFMRSLYCLALMAHHRKQYGLRSFAAEVETFVRENILLRKAEPQLRSEPVMPKGMKEQVCPIGYPRVLALLLHQARLLEFLPKHRPQNHLP